MVTWKNINKAPNLPNAANAGDFEHALGGYEKAINNLHNIEKNAKAKGADIHTATEVVDKLCGQMLGHIENLAKTANLHAKIKEALKDYKKKITDVQGAMKTTRTKHPK